MGLGFWWSGYHVNHGLRINPNAGLCACHGHGVYYVEDGSNAGWKQHGNGGWTYYEPKQVGVNCPIHGKTGFSLADEAFLKEIGILG